METSSTGEKEPENLFFCHLCGVSCASALNLQSHFMGTKHKKVEESLRTNKPEKDKEEKDEDPDEKKPITTLQEQIDACQNSEPALGLEYIIQYYRKRGYYLYDCKLCDCRAGLTHMFMHIIGAKHRMNYLEKHHPELGICGPYIMKGPKKLKKLRDICLKVEKEYGRQKINIYKPFIHNNDISSVFYTPDSELEKMDFTNDDFFDPGSKPEDDSEHIVTFLELKAAYEAELRRASSDDIENNTESEKNDSENKAEDESKKITSEEDVPEEDSENKAEDTSDESKKITSEEDVPSEIKESESKVEDLSDESKMMISEEDLPDEEKDSESKVEDTGGESKKDTSEEEVTDEEPSDSDDDFTNNKELLDFLEHFRIWEEKDAKFIIKVVEMLSLSLLRHKKDFKEKKVQSISTSNDQDNSKKQDPNQEAALRSKEATTAGSPDKTLDPETQTKTQLFPIPQPGERKKLKFTFSATKAQESAVKLIQRPETLGSTANVKAKANVFEEDENEDTPEKSDVSQKVPVSQLSNRKPASESQPSSSQAPDSKVDYERQQQHHSSHREVNRERNMTQDSKLDYERQQQQHHGSHREVNSSVRNMTKDSKFDYERQQQQYHGSHREVNSSVRNMTQVQPVVYPAPQVTRGAPSAQTLIPPPRAPFPPRAAPPLFPIAQNDIVNKFFESIKNMEIAEVTSTLNKITATNPAFKGIHVPSLIRYLTETGKLKPSQSVQQLNQ